MVGVGVRIIGSSKVGLAAGTDYPPPGSTVKLSLFDVRWVSFQPMKTLLLYPAPSNSSSFELELESLKSSLALVLPRFHLLAGDLTYLPDSDDVAIICSDEASVSVIEAESDLDISRLASDPTLDIEACSQLVANTMHEQLPMPALSVQFTKFSCGGVALGISTHHVAVDAWGLWQFLDCWARTCRDGVVPSGPAPLHDRATMGDASKEEITRKLLHSLAPNLPKVNPVATISDLKKLTRRVFTVDQTTIQLLKKRAVDETGTDIATPPTTFQVLASHIWISIARARGVTAENDKPTSFLCLIDARTLLPPPMSTLYTGNLLYPCLAQSNGSALMSANGFGRTCGNIAETVRKEKARISGSGGREKLTLSPASFSGVTVKFLGSNRLDMCSFDFGWGKPEREALVSMNSDCEVLMNAGKEKGGVQLTVVLKDDMDAFTDVFEAGLLSLNQQSQPI